MLAKLTRAAARTSAAALTCAAVILCTGHAAAQEDLGDTDEPVDPWTSPATLPEPSKKEDARAWDVPAEPPPRTGAMGPAPDWDTLPVMRETKPVVDVRPSVGGILVASGAFLFGAGASLYADAGTQLISSVSTCTPSMGCFSVNTVARDVQAEAPAVALMASGGTAFLFGGALAIHGAAESEPFPHRSSRRLAAGMLLTGYGLSATVGSSAMIMHGAIVGNEGSALVSAVMYLPAAGLLFTGVPLWITGSRPPKVKKGDRARSTSARPGGEKTVFRSPTMASLGLGITALGLGVVAGGVVSALEGERLEDEEDREREERREMLEQAGGFLPFEEGRRRPERAITILANAAAGAALVSLGLPLAIVGLGQTSPHEAHAFLLPMPEINVGPTNVRVTWRY